MSRPSTPPARRSRAGASAATVSRHVQRSRDGYTLQHAGRQIRIGPVAFWIVVGTLVVMAVWSILTGTYFAFREDVLTGLIGRQAQMQFAYEDRIAELRAQVDRITSRQLLDQEQFEQKLKSLLQRQATLEQRTDALAGDALTTGSIPPANRAPRARAAEPPKPSPISDTVIYVAPPDREARLQSREMPAVATRLAAGGEAGGLSGVLARVSGRARPDRATAERGAYRHRGAGRQQGAPLAQRAERSRRGDRRPTESRGRRPVRAAPPAQAGRQRLRPPALPYQSRARADRPLKPRAGRRAGAQAGAGRNRHELAVRRAHGSLPGAPGHAYRPRPARRDRRTGLCHCRRQNSDRRARGRLRQHGRDRPRQRLVHPLRPSVRDRCEGRADRAHRAGDRQDRLDRPVHRPASALRDAHHGEPVNPQKFLRAGLRLGKV